MTSLRKILHARVSLTRHKCVERYVAARTDKLSESGRARSSPSRCAKAVERELRYAIEVTT
jgi:hypothetical protein